MIGQTLGHYQITDKLGQGGMGSVWRAQDSKLGRQVAIKTLPEEFAQDEERLARFEREAKLLASLNHPNIAAIYGLEEDNGTRFLVLELVEGDTLADRLKRGAIPVEETLKLALQIAEALEAAHEKGVIHRDLKPANIKVTPEGKIKVLDFGLAKAFSADGSDVNVSQSPTLSMAATQQGVILGTAAYMSPEQAQSQDVDKRADIWAFGCIVYEMLTGRSVFAGDNMSLTLARVLERRPDFSALPPRIHSRVRELLERCLEKEARNRLHDIADARVDIQKVLTDPGGVLALPRSDQVRPFRQNAALLMVVAVVVAAIVGIAFWSFRPRNPIAPVAHLTIVLPENQQLAGLAAMSPVAVSPDGASIAYVAIGDGIQQLYVRHLSSPEARLIPGTEGAVGPFFSPDSESLGFVAGSQLKTVAIGGGRPTVLASATNYRGGSWGSAGDIVFPVPVEAEASREFPRREVRRRNP